MMFPDYYKILGLSKEATKEEIKKAYRKLALDFHPDVNKSPDAEANFIKINNAYLILYDDTARRKYDIEYDLFSKQSGVFNSKTKEKEGYSYDRGYSFNDEDLNDWVLKAKEQAKEYSRMAFEDFYNLLIGVAKETKFQLGNTFLMFFGLMLSVGGIGNIIIGLFGNLACLFFGIIILPIGILLRNSAEKNWSKHKL